jgi:predicted pyridoxine 5'-phosphate oxidase superfamily flavin-nucleotide-binding protein
MLSTEMVRLLEKQRLGFIATVSPAGRPNVSPKGTFVVIDSQTIAFGEIRSPKTLANLQAHPFAEVNFVDPLARKGFRASGRATIAASDTGLYRQHIGRFDRWGTLAKRIRNIANTHSHGSEPIHENGKRA